MSPLWLISVLIIGFLLDVDASANCPYHQKATRYGDTQLEYLPKGSTYSKQLDVSAESSSEATGGYERVEYSIKKNKCRSIGGLESQCRPAKDCSIWYDVVRATPRSTCLLPNGYGHGVCCPDLPINST